MVLLCDADATTCCSSTLIMQLGPETMNMLSVNYGSEFVGWAPCMCMGPPLMTSSILYIVLPTDEIYVYDF